MRSRLLILLSLVVLLLQPISLLHALSHQNAGAPRGTPSWSQASGAAVADATRPADDSVCLQCLVLGALGLGVLPALVRVAVLGLAQPAPVLRAKRPHGGTAAGYHARGPPTPALTA